MIYTNLASQKGRFSFQPEESGEVTKLATTSFKGMIWTPQTQKS